jgi:hypothetical protein
MTDQPKDGPGFPDYIVENFEELRRACVNLDLALFSVERAENGEPVALVCAVNGHKKDGGLDLIPLAEMINDNPFDGRYKTDKGIITQSDPDNDGPVFDTRDLN